MTGQPELFGPDTRRPGPVETAAVAAVDAAGLTGAADALMVAHLFTVAAAVDRCAGRVDPRGMTMLSRELRACASDLGLTRPTAPAPAAGPFDFLDADT